MDRSDAERVFQLVAELQGELHDRFVPDRWWLVWVLMGFEILVTNCSTQWLINRGVVDPRIHFGIFAAQVIALAATIRIAQSKSGGMRTQREAFIWWIWTTFLIAASISGLINLALKLEFFKLAPILPLLGAVSFSIMGMAIDRLFTVAAILFAACAVAMALVPSLQFYLYGVVWFVTLETFGYLHRPRASAGHAL